MRIIEDNEHNEEKSLFLLLAGIVLTRKEQAGGARGILNKQPWVVQGQKCWLLTLYFELGPNINLSSILLVCLSVQWINVLFFFFFNTHLQLVLVECFCCCSVSSVLQRGGWGVLFFQRNVN